MTGPAQRETVLEGGGGAHARNDALLFIDIPKLTQITLVYGRDIAAEVSKNVADHVRSTFRPGDLLFRQESNEFVALLRGADVGTADRVAERIRDGAGLSCIMLPSGERLALDITVRRTTAPQTVEGPRQSIGSLRTQRRQPDADDKTRVH